ncbi:MAG: insulinase family protein [bacterium]|nr:insulinase family protein [bacterium]
MIKAGNKIMSLQALAMMLCALMLTWPIASFADASVPAAPSAQPASAQPNAQQASAQLGGAQPASTQPNALQTIAQPLNAPDWQLLLAQSGKPGDFPPLQPAFGKDETFKPSTYKLGTYSLPSQSRQVFTQSSVTRTMLANGMSILVQELPYDNTAAIEVLIKCGLSQEGSNHQGLTGFILEILSDRITRDASGDDIAEMTGSSVETEATPDYARISVKLLAGNTNLLIDRIAAAFSQRSFNNEEIERARRRLLTALEGGQGAHGQLYDLFLSNFYRYHPYKRTTKGSPAIIKRADAQELASFFNEFFVPNKMVFVISGDVNSAACAKRVSAGFSALTPCKDNTIEVQWEPKASEKEIYLSTSSNLAWVFLGYPAPEMQSADYAAMKIVYAALGQGLSSRLWYELRETRGLAYELGALYPDLYGPSHMLCYIVTKPASVGEARRRMIGEVKRMRDQGMGQAELNETKNKLIGDYLLHRESNSGRALHFAAAELAGGYEADLRFLSDLDRVTVDDVNKAAKKYLDKATLIVARPGGRMYFDW